MWFSTSPYLLSLLSGSVEQDLVYSINKRCYLTYTLRVHAIYTPIICTYLILLVAHSGDQCESRHGLAAASAFASTGCLRLDRDAELKLLTAWMEGCLPLEVLCVGQCQ